MARWQGLEWSGTLRPGLGQRWLPPRGQVAPALAAPPARPQQHGCRTRAQWRPCSWRYQWRTGLPGRGSTSCGNVGMGLEAESASTRKLKTAKSPHELASQLGGSKRRAADSSSPVGSTTHTTQAGIARTCHTTTNDEDFGGRHAAGSRDLAGEEAAKVLRSLHHRAARAG